MDPEQLFRVISGEESADRVSQAMRAFLANQDVARFEQAVAVFVRSARARGEPVERVLAILIEIAEAREGAAFPHDWTLTDLRLVILRGVLLAFYGDTSVARREPAVERRGGGERRRTVERGLARVVTPPPPAPGFMGEGHTAVPVVEPNDFERSDPFILLMDDRIDLPAGCSAGGAHPHAGFEVVTFVVEGELRDRDEGQLRAGDVVWMTAGSGVIHNEDVLPLGKSRILQLWLTLPSSARWVAPRVEHVAHDAAPLRREPGVEARVYSGSSGPVRAATHNYVPVTMVDVRLDPGAAVAQELPGSYSGFVYVLDGEVVAGGLVRQRLTAGQVGWLENSDASTATCLRLTGGEQGARLVLYAGERQGVPIVMHGPFVGESRSDLMRVSQDYVQGRMPRVSALAKR